MKDKLREVTIKLSVFVKEDTDEGGFNLDKYDENNIADAVETELRSIRSAHYYERFDILGVSVAKIK